MPCITHDGKLLFIVGNSDVFLVIQFRYSVADLKIDHLVHHLLAMWSLGATPDEIQDMWDYNKGYQTSIKRPDAIIPADLNLQDQEQFEACLGKDEHYLTFLKFFKAEIAEKGAIPVIRQYVLKGDKRANDIFSRMYTGKSLPHDKLESSP